MFYQSRKIYFKSIIWVGVASLVHLSVNNVDWFIEKYCWVLVIFFIIYLRVGKTENIISRKRLLKLKINQSFHRKLLILPCLCFPTCIFISVDICILEGKITFVVNALLFFNALCLTGKSINYGMTVCVAAATLSVTVACLHHTLDSSTAHGDKTLKRYALSHIELWHIVKGHFFSM